MKKSMLKELFVAVCFSTACNIAIAQEEPARDQLRQQAKELMVQARELKAEGKVEEAARLGEKAKHLMIEAEKGRKKGDKAEKADRPKKKNDAAKRDRHETELRERDEHPDVEEREERRVIRREFEIERAPGREGFGAPAERFRRFQDFQRRMHPPAGPRFGARPFPGEPRQFQGPGRPGERFGPMPPMQGPRAYGNPPRPFRPMSDMERQGDFDRGQRAERPRPEMQEMQQRQHHVREAIRHLRAAGLHEPAEHLERNLQERMERLQRERAHREHDEPRRDDGRRERNPHPQPREGDGDRERESDRR